MTSSNIPTSPRPGTANWGTGQNATDDAQTQAITDLQTAVGALPNTYLPRWKANTAVAGNDIWLLPTGQIGQRKTGQAASTGAVFDPSAWTILSAPIPNVIALGNVSGTVTLDLSSGLAFTATAIGDVSVQFTNFPAYYVEPVLLLKEDTTGGRAISVPGVTWQPNGTAPTWVTTANALNVITVASPDGGVTLLGQSGPMPHAVTHGSGGVDAITIAQAQVTGLPAALAALQGAGTPVERNTASALASKYATTAPAAGVFVFETDTRLWKLGDGSTTWPTLPYVGGHLQQRFTASGTWTKLPGLKFIRLRIITPGNGGGSGASGVTSTAQNGGAPGAPGTVYDIIIRVADLPDSVAVTVGAFGAGGAAVTAGSGASVAGNPGGAAGDVSFGSLLVGKTGPACTASGQGTTVGSTSYTLSGTNGSKSLPLSASANGAAGGTATTNIGGSAGAGGGITSAGAGTNGGAAQPNNLNVGTSTAAAGVAGASGSAGGNGVASPSGDNQGNGGAGGGGNPSGAGWAGGNGGGWGGAGGGGGASKDGSPSGKGGDGGPGICIIENHF